MTATEAQILEIQLETALINRAAARLRLEAARQTLRAASHARLETVEVTNAPLWHLDHRASVT